MIRQQALFNSILGILVLAAWAVLDISITASVFAQQSIPLRYKLEIGDKYSYKFDAQMSVDGERRTTEGFVTLEVQNKNVSNKLSGDPLENSLRGEATSTAFAVSSDGYLLTCAHCVNGAEQVQIVSGEKSWEATVVETNLDRDLAILKIDSNDLPFVPLGKNQKVELAQDVRAIGYPLSDMLGDTVKITRGSIAGFVNQGFGQSMQIDAAVNPGNSGGPLVDENGVAIGVVNAKLDGLEIAKVGFAIPISDACEMLDRHNVQYDSKVVQQEISGPELAQKVAPAVFFVKAVFGEDGRKQFSNYQISALGSMTESGEREMIQSKAIFGLDGMAVDGEGTTELPLLLGPVIEMPFEILPGTSAKTWRSVNVIGLTLPSGPAKKRGNGRLDPFDPFGHMDPFRRHRNRFPSFGPRGFFGAENDGIGFEFQPVIGEQEVVYKEIARNGSNVDLIRTFKLKSMNGKKAFSNLSYGCESKLTFDMEQGVFVKSSLRGTVKLKLGQENVRIPVRMNFELVESQKGDAPSKRPSTPQSNANVKRFEISKERLEQFVREYEQLSDRDLLQALNAISTWTLNEGVKVNSQLSDAMDNLARSKNASVRQAAINGLMHFDRQRAVPHLARALADANAFSKQGWIVKLGRTKSADAAKILCEHFVLPSTRTAAKFALIENGVTGETAMLELLQKHIEDARLAEICLDVIGKIGGPDSIEMIEKLLLREDWDLADAAKQTLSDLRHRNQ